MTDSNKTETPSRKNALLRTALILLFVYGGVAYSLSMIEYSFFNLTGHAAFGVEKKFDSITREELMEEFKRCEGPLFGAFGVETENIGDPIVVRCGRFWPFYSYSLLMPANNLIPGALIQYDDEPAEITTKKASLAQNTVIISGAFILLALVVLGLSGFALYKYAIKRDEEKAYRWAFQSFVTCVLMFISYIGLMSWLNPLFRLGW